MKIKFLLAEDIRTEQNGKHLVIGLLPDDVVLIPTAAFDEDGSGEAPPAGLDRLSFLITISQIDAGHHQASFEFRSPTGQTIGSIPDTSFDTEEGKSASFVFNVAPFILHGTGEYSVLLTLDGTTHPLPFEIRAEN